MLPMLPHLIDNITSIENKTINGSTDPRPPEEITWNPWHGMLYSYKLLLIL